MTGSSKQKEYIRRYVTKHPSRRLWSVVKHRAKARGLEFDLERDELQIPDVCPILGIPIEVGAGKQGKGVTYKPNFASVDRIDPSKGYTKDNVRVISFLANTMKRDATKEQLLAFAYWVIKELGPTTGGTDE